ncbi:351_t:CDS:1, partial [Acaulospora colombiana]
MASTRRSARLLAIASGSNSNVPDATTVTADEAATVPQETTGDNLVNNETSFVNETSDGLDVTTRSQAPLSSVAENSPPAYASQDEDTLQEQPFTLVTNSRRSGSSSSSRSP